MASARDRRASRPRLSIEDMVGEAAARPDVASPLANPSATRLVLDEFGHSAKKKLGQNFLVNDAVVGKIISLAEVGEGDRVLEVGPGIGTLTIAMLRRADSVLAVERDPALPAVLARTTAPWSDRFRLVEKDALDLGESDFDADGGAAPNKFVANLPYAVAATLVLDYFQRFPNLESATVMVQKEVADRIAAEPGSKNYGAYTVKLGMYARVTGRFSVGPGNFFPPPHVDSAVVRLDRSSVLDDGGAALTREEVEAGCTVADASFASRRKTLGNSFKAYFASRGKSSPIAATGETFSRMFERAGIDASRRGETLTQAEFVRLARAYCAERDGLSG